MLFSILILAFQDDLEPTNFPIPHNVEESPQPQNFYPSQPRQYATQLLGSINLGDVRNQVEYATAVTPLVVVPADKLDEVGVELDTGLGVEDGRVGVAVQVAGDDLVLSVGENAWFRVSLCLSSGESCKLTLHFTLRSLLDGGLDLIVAGTLLDADGQVDNRDVGGRDTHGHAGKLAVKVGDDLADSLGGASAAGDDVLSSTAATSPVLGGGTIDGLLGSGVGVDSGHEALNDGELVVNDLGEGGQAVGGARSIGDDLGAAVVGLLVDAHHVHGGIGRGCRDDDTLGTTLQVKTSLLLGGEDTGGLDDVLGASVLPGNGSGVPLSVKLDGLAVDL